MNRIADLHCDTLTYLKNNNEGLFENLAQIDIKRLKAFETPFITFAICLDGKGKNCFDETKAYINYFLDQLELNKEHIALVKSYNDIGINNSENKISALLAIEGGEAFEKDLTNIKEFYNMGVRLVTLTWNDSNALGNGIMSGMNDGLTEFGAKAIKELQKYNMIIDVSHLNEKGFWDTMELTDGVVIASHSNCKSLCNHVRNLTDEQIRAIADKNGVVGVNLFPDFLKDSKNAVLEDILPHIKHITSIADIDSVCIGSDFDGVRYLPKDVKDISSFNSIENILLKYYSKDDVQKIMYKNIMRIMKQVLK